MTRYFYDWLFYALVWVVVTLFYSFIFIYIGHTVVDMLNVESIVNADKVFGYMISNYQYIEGLIFGLLFGTISFGINIGMDYTAIHKLSYGKIILIKSVLYFIAIAVIFWLLSGIVFVFGIAPFTKEEYQAYIATHPIPIPFYITLIVFFGTSAILINYITIVSRKFGPGQMFNIFLGRYNRPRTENRIFMFLDLKDSTAISEKLGHIIYSKLLQQCIHDLNGLIPNSGAEIYQYVGDEVVLTWNIKNYNLNFIKPIELFYEFKEKLELKNTFYKSRFGVAPEFKAGINAGVVTVAEIGDIKKEIAYHGDVVNTTSRLRSACSEFKKDLLASEYVIKNINGTHEFKIKEIGDIALKGKLQNMKAYSIE